MVVITSLFYALDYVTLVGIQYVNLIPLKKYVVERYPFAGDYVANGI